MKKKKILLISFAIVLATVVNLFAGMITVGAATPTFSGGTGTQNDPYLISNADDLKALADMTNNSTEAINGGKTGTSGLYFKLTDDIDLSDNGTQTDFTPIGYSTSDDVQVKNFGGHFDGNGKTISGFKIDAANVTNNRWIALFPAVRDEGSVKDLRIANASYIINGGYMAGGIVGVLGAVSNRASTVSGCITASDVSITVTTGTQNTDLKIGGIVGYVQQNSIVENCENNATISFNDTSSTKYSYVAGIAGGSCSTIKNCVNKGAVTIAGYTNKLATHVFAAGIVGQLNPWGGLTATVENCVNYASITNAKVGESDIYYAAGIIGHVAGSSAEDRVIKNNFNLGKLAGKTGQIAGAFATNSYNSEGNYGTKGLGWTFSDDDGVGLSGMETILQADILTNAKYLAIVDTLENNLKFTPGTYTLPTGFAEVDPEIPSMGDIFGDDEDDDGENTNNGNDNGNDNKNDNKNNNSNNNAQTTEAPAATESAPVEEKSGCGSVVGVAALSVLGLVGAVSFAIRKKED